MNPRIALTAIMAGTLLSSCGFQTDDVYRDIDQAFLINTWFHAYEKDCGAEMAFKPYMDSFMTTWRVRNRLELLTDGSASYSIATPDDPHRFEALTYVEGTWTFDPADNELRILDSLGHTAFVFEVRNVLPGCLHMVYREKDQPDDER